MAIQDRLGSQSRPTGMSGRLGKNVTNTNNTDARSRLIQKKRANINDARDRLAQITKSKGDIRSILNNKTHAAKKQTVTPTRIADVNVDYAEVYQNLSAGLKRKIQEKIVSQNSNVGRQQGGQVQRRQAPRPVPLAQKSRIQNRIASKDSQSRTSVQNGALVRTVAGRANPVVVAKPKQRPPPVRVTTIRSPPRPAPRQRNRLDMRKERSPFRTARPEPRVFVNRRPEPVRTSRPDPWIQQEEMEYDIVPRNRPTYVRAEPNYITVDEWDAGLSASNGMAASPVYEEAYQYVQPRKTILSQGMVSRLDEERKVTHYSEGYKILVSNLHRAVTLEDVEELFGNIGPLSSVRMLQQGTAEIVFINKDDAYKSIEVYHYRLLDGQPMNVAVVSEGPSKRPAPTRVLTSRAPPTKRLVTESLASRPVAKSVLRSAGGSTRYEYVPSRSSGPQSRIAPSTGITREALYERKKQQLYATPKASLYAYGSFR